MYDLLPFFHILLLMKFKNLLKNFLRILISAVIIYLILRGLDIQKISGLLKGYNFGYFFAALVLFLLNYNIIVLRWKVITGIQLKDYSVSFWKLMKFSLTGMFFNTFLPSSIGGDIYRCYAFGREPRTGSTGKRNIEKFGPASASVPAPPSGRCSPTMPLGPAAA